MGNLPQGPHRARGSRGRRDGRTTRSGRGCRCSRTPAGRARETTGPERSPPDRPAATRRARRLTGSRHRPSRRQVNASRTSAPAVIAAVAGTTGEVLLRGERHRDGGQGQQPDVARGHAPAQHRRQQQRVAGDARADGVDQRRRAGREGDGRQRQSGDDARGAAQLPEDGPRRCDQARPGDDHRHEEHAERAAEHPHRKGEQVEVQRARVVHRRDALGVEPPTATAGRAGACARCRCRGPAGPSAPGRPAVTTPAGSARRPPGREGQCGADRHGPPALPPVQVAPPVDRPGAGLAAGRGRASGTGSAGPGCAASSGDVDRLGRRGAAPPVPHPPHANRRTPPRPRSMWHHGDARWRVGGVGWGPRFRWCCPPTTRRRTWSSSSPRRPPSCRATGLTFEVVVVDDGSTDGTADIMRELSDREVATVSLRRNAGKSAALDAGLARVQGEYVVLMDADGQDDPTEIPRLLAALDADDGLDLVTGRRAVRHDRLVKRTTSRLYNWVTALVTGVKGRDFNSGFKAMRRELATTLEPVRRAAPVHPGARALARLHGRRGRRRPPRAPPRRVQVRPGPLLAGVPRPHHRQVPDHLHGRPFHLFGGHRRDHGGRRIGPARMDARRAHRRQPGRAPARAAGRGPAGGGGRADGPARAARRAQRPPARTTLAQRAEADDP